MNLKQPSQNKGTHRNSNGQPYRDQQQVTERVPGLGGTRVVVGVADASGFGHARRVGDR